MNRSDLINVAYKRAQQSFNELDEKYTCPQCRDKWMFDPDTRHCGKCGYRPPTLLMRFAQWWKKRFR